MTNPKSSPANQVGMAELCLRLYQKQNQVRALLAATELLADSQRVLNAIDGDAKHDPAFWDRLSQASTAWRNPIGGFDGECELAVIAGLARVAREMAREVEDGIETLSDLADEEGGTA